MPSLKQSVKQIFIKKREKQYQKELFEKKKSYYSWIKEQEKAISVDDIIVSEISKCLKNDTKKISDAGNELKNEGFDSECIPNCRYYEVFDKNEGKTASKTFLHLLPQSIRTQNCCDIAENVQNIDADVILLQVLEGEMADFTLPLMYCELKKNKNIILIYGDEDVQNGAERYKPWLKPDWSPDTFLSSYYFGSFIAIKRTAILEILAQSKWDDMTLYELCLEVIARHNGFGMRPENGKETVCHIPEVLFHATKEGYLNIHNWKLPEKAVKALEKRINPKGQESKEELVSVIIPSKDNPEVLFTCIRSFLQKTPLCSDYEIIIVDNGSNASNKNEIETQIKLNQEVCCGKEVRIRYYYEPMPFNFSQMCNMGASYAKGDYLLFLNDDMEIIQEDWLSLLMEKARLPYAGAVGAKLLYPDSSIIQHAGITNLRVGPAHKLQFLSDEENHYYGRNRGVHDVMAVTGACLLVKNEVFHKVGGFERELAVAFNDVDLCYKIFEEGYYNIVRNDVVLYHHESLSRGKDGESEEKQLRLLREKDVLYERHQGIYGKDPFYHKYLTNDMLESDYSPAYHYQVTLDMPWAKVKAMEVLPNNIREDNCVVIGMEGAMDIYKWKYGVAPGKGKKEPLEEELGYYFQGYTFVIGANNACYKNTLLLENKATKQVLAVEVHKRYRPDIKKNLKDQLNVDLTGFAAKVRWKDIPKGEYRFAMLSEDTCSRQKLVSYSSWVLQVDGLTQQVSDTLPKEK